MRPIDSESWTLLVEAGKAFPDLPDELGKVLALPYAALVPLPWFDDSRPRTGGVCFLPEWEEVVIDAASLEFLDEQVRQEGEGALKRRRAALAPFVDRVLVRYVLRWDRFDASIEIDAPTQQLVHVEIDRRKG